MTTSTIWTIKDIEIYRENYGVMLDLIYQNPIVSNILNNVARPSQLEGYSKIMISALSDNIPLLMQNFVSLIESEYVFVSTHKEPFVFLRERSRIAARATGDYVNELMKPVVSKHLSQIIDRCYDLKVKDSQNVKMMTELNKEILSVIYSENFIKDIPLPVKFIIKQIFIGAQKFGFGQYSYMLTGNMLFLRCVCPMISVPEYYKVNNPSRGAPSQPARKVLVLQGKLLSNVANFSQGHQFELDEQLLQFKEHITGNSTAYCALIDKIISADFTPYPSVSTARHDEHFEEVSVQQTNTNMESTSGFSNFVTPTVIKGVDSTNLGLICQQFSENGTPTVHNSKLFPHEIIREELKREYNLNTNSMNYPLRHLACIHHALIEHKQHIYDVIQAMYCQETEFMSTFEQKSQEEKFERLINQYAMLAYIPSSRVLNMINKLIRLLQQAPPLAEEVDYRPLDPRTAQPKFYQVIKVNYAGKHQKRAVKFTNFSLLNVDGDLRIANPSGGRKVGKFNAPVIKNEITGNEILSIKVDENEPNITLIVNISDAEEKQEGKQRIYICNNKLSRDQMLGEIFEMCYWQRNQLLTFQVTIGGSPYILKLTKDSMLKIRDNRILADYHVIKLTTEIQNMTLTYTYEDAGQHIQENAVFQKAADVQLFQNYMDYCRSVYKPNSEPDIDKL